MLLNPSDIVMWKKKKGTNIAYRTIAGLSKPIPEDVLKENGLSKGTKYYHIAYGIIDRTIIDATPKGVCKRYITDEFIKKERKNADLEIWEYKGDLSEYQCVDMAKWAIDRIGLKYDWLAIFASILPWLGINAFHRFHCAEYGHGIYGSQGIQISNEGIDDNLVSPNNIISSNLFRKRGEIV